MYMHDMEFAPYVSTYAVTNFLDCPICNSYDIINLTITLLVGRSARRGERKYANHHRLSRQPSGPASFLCALCNTICRKEHKMEGFVEGD